jgi:hypothetical protein
MLQKSILASSQQHQQQQHNLSFSKSDEEVIINNKLPPGAISLKLHPKSSTHLSFTNTQPLVIQPTSERHQALVNQH